MFDNTIKNTCLKSNLISHLRSSTINLHNQRLSQHLRLQKVCFSNVLQTIRKEACRMQEEMKTQIEREKQNEGIYLQAYNFKALSIGNDLVSICRPVKKQSHHAPKTFVIRSCNMRKNPVCNNVQNCPKPQQFANTIFCLNLKEYRLPKYKQAKQKPRISLRQCYQTNPKLAILIPSYIILQDCHKNNKLNNILTNWNKKDIEIFIITSPKDKIESFSNKNIKQICNYIHIDCVDAFDKEIFMDWSNICIQNIIIFRGGWHFGNWFVVPFQQNQGKSVIKIKNYKKENQFGNLFQIDAQHEQRQYGLKLAFLEICHIQAIKSVEIEQIVIKLSIDQAIKMQLTHHEYPLIQQLKIKMINQNKNSTNHNHYTQSLQKSLTKHIQTLKSTHPIPGSCRKTPQQIIKQLMKNNQHIHRQILEWQPRQYGQDTPKFSKCNKIGIYRLE